MKEHDILYDIRHKVGDKLSEALEILLTHTDFDEPNFTNFCQHAGELINDLDEFLALI